MCIARGGGGGLTTRLTYLGHAFDLRHIKDAMLVLLDAIYLET